MIGTEDAKSIGAEDVGSTERAGTTRSSSKGEAKGLIVKSMQVASDMISKSPTLAH